MYRLDVSTDHEAFQLNTDLNTDACMKWVIMIMGHIRMWPGRRNDTITITVHHKCYTYYLVPAENSVEDR